MKYPIKPRVYDKAELSCILSGLKSGEIIAVPTILTLYEWWVLASGLFVIAILTSVANVTGKMAGRKPEEPASC